MCATISPVQRRWMILGVFLASLVILGWNAAAPGVASAYVDPVGKVQDQDEALYGSISLRMAATGHIMTPVFLGRYEIVKPPLLDWLEAIGMRLTGQDRLAMRLPSIFAGAGTVAIVFAWLIAQGAGGVAGALTGALLLLSTHLFFVLSRTGLTDALLTFFTTLAMFALARDPRLSSRLSVWTFGLASGGALMTKGIAGLFPLLALGVFLVISRERPSLGALLQVVAISAAIAAPWHLYELWRHTRWFVAQYIRSEIVTDSLSAPYQSTAEETHLGYYLKRVIALDAPLAVAAAAALAFTWKRTQTRVLLAWIAVVLAAAMAFSYRNTSYLLPVFPALALLVGSALVGAVSPKKLARWTLALAVLLFAGKAAAPAQTWGLPFGQEAAMPSEAILDRYAALHRGNELIVGDPDDEFYSACLNLPQVRYLYIDPNHQPAASSPSALDFEYLGVTVTAVDFARLPELAPQFLERLHDWGLDDPSPIATVILANNLEQVEALVHDHPEADFFLPSVWGSLDNGTHDLIDDSNGRELLVSREVIYRPGSRP